MKTEFHLQISKEDIMDVFLDSLQQDVLAYTGREVKKSDLKAGFVYKKNISDNPKKKIMTIVRLTEFNYPNHYAVEYSRDGYRKKAVYDFLDDEKGGCRFIMSQEVEKRQKSKDGQLVWNVIDPMDKVKKPSLMAKYRMRAAIKYSKKLKKENAVETVA